MMQFYLEMALITVYFHEIIIYFIQAHIIKYTLCLFISTQYSYAHLILNL